jgi:cytoplasmic iron level regulating protein YaaA (DUF328/UPF0246 family)
MIIILSPAKSLDFKSPGPAHLTSRPEFEDEASVIASKMKKMSVKELGSLMKISAKLAYDSYDFYQKWNPSNVIPDAKQALLAYKGDAYRGLDAASLDDADLNWAQDHLRILSGLYGILRPLDLISPYRLEFVTKINLGQYNGLYPFWKEKINRSLLDLENTEGSHILVNLASAEYYNAIDRASTGFRVITPVFKEYRNGEYRFFSMFGKRARGLMARYIIQQRISDPEEMKLFDAEGYTFSAPLSQDDEWVFTR